HHYVSCILDDLFHMQVLSKESKTFIMSLMSILNWLEKDYAAILSFFVDKMQIYDRSFQGQILPKDFKKYLIYSSQSKFIQAFKEDELLFLTKISNSQEFWMEYFEGKAISFESLGQWVGSFQENYLEAFILSSIHFLRIYGDLPIYRHRMKEILQEFLIEEKFVQNLVLKAQVDISGQQFLELLSKRFYGELKSIKSLMGSIQKI
ncbi:hypothetical protein MJH12_03650, partial [bacterium]|nr:hypothetical protein [bacterium]